MTTSDKRALRDAAELLHKGAVVIHVSETVDGRWPAGTDGERLEYNEHMRLAARLRAIAGRE